jgi:hypothetical protein
VPGDWGFAGETLTAERRGRNIELSEDDLSQLAELPAASGERYDEAGMRSVNV